MLLFYVRHGDPIYDPDSLTPLGKRQAEAAAKRLALYGIDRIYASTSNRAIQTAEPLAEIVKKDITLLNFADEALAWRDFTVERNGQTTWLFHDEKTKRLFSENEIVSLGNDWCTHPEMKKYRAGVDRVYNETFEFFEALGYKHIRNTGRYEVVKSNNERVAFFAHQGFGIAFLSTVLDIPYPIVANHFDICHTGITAISFEEQNGYAIPKLLTLSSEAHLYKEGLPTLYNYSVNL